MGGGGGKRVDIRVGGCNGLILLSFSRTDKPDKNRHFSWGGGGGKRVDIRVGGCNALISFSRTDKPDKYRHFSWGGGVRGWI